MAYRFTIYPPECLARLLEFPAIEQSLNHLRCEQNRGHRLSAPVISRIGANLLDQSIDAIQLEAGRLPSLLPAGDSLRARFDYLHQLSTRLMMANIVGALVLLYWEARDHGQ